MSSRRVLVLGSTGFIGRHVAESFRNAGWQVHGVGRRPAPHQDGITFHVCDITNARALHRLLDEASPDTIVFAAMDWSNLSVQIDTSVLAVSTCARYSRGASFLVIGSSAEYAPRGEEAVTEQAPVQPLTAYGCLKACEVRLALSLHPERDVRGLRPFNPIGVGMSERLAAASFARQIAAIAAHQAPPVLFVGNLDTIRDFHSARDVGAAAVAVAERGRSGEVYNCCSGVGRTVRDLLQGILDLSGLRIEVRPDATRFRALEISCQIGCHDLLSRETGWTPSVSWESALEELWRDSRARFS